MAGTLRVLRVDMTKQEQQKARYAAGQATALDDAKRGVSHEPRARDQKDWAAGYRATMADLRASFGPDFLQKMSAP